jgi:hypothetical protein
MKKQFTGFAVLPLFVVALVSALIFSCAIPSSTDESGRVTYQNEDLRLVDITDATTYSRGAASMARGATARKAKPELIGNVSITLTAEVEPPQDADGTSLQASHVWLTENGKYAIVGYMLQGDAISGAVDVIDVSEQARPKIVSTLLLPGFELAAVIEEANTLYLAGRTSAEDASGGWAHVEAYSISSKGVLGESALASVTLPGYFATALAFKTHKLYVTTGAYSDVQTAVGLYVLDSATLAVTDQLTTGLPDLRSVIVEGSDVSVLEASYGAPATDASIRTFAKGELDKAPTVHSLASYPTTAESKSGLIAYGDVYFAALNRSGLAIVDPSAGSPVQGSIPVPSLEGIDPDKQSTNSVSTGDVGAKKLIYIANGEAGLWVAAADSIESQSGASTENIAGSIRFGAGESVNYIASKNKLAVAAVGTGGLKILTIEVD